MTTPAVQTTTPVVAPPVSISDGLDRALLNASPDWTVSLTRTYCRDAVVREYDSMRHEIEADIVRSVLNRAAHLGRIPTAWNIGWTDHVNTNETISATIVVSVVLVPVDVVLS